MATFKDCRAKELLSLTTVPLQELSDDNVARNPTTRRLSTDLRHIQFSQQT